MGSLRRSTRLPKLRKDAQIAYDGYVKTLGRLPPPPPENPVSELLQLVTVFARATNNWINGADQCERLVQRYRAASVDFKADIHKTAPDFRPFDSAEAQEVSNAKFHNAIEDDPLDVLSDNIGGSNPLTMYLPQVREHLQR